MRNEYVIPVPCLESVCGSFIEVALHCDRNFRTIKGNLPKLFLWVSKTYMYLNEEQIFVNRFLFKFHKNFALHN